MTVISTSPQGINVVVGSPPKQIFTTTPYPDVDVTVGTPGIQGKPGPEGGTPVVAIPYNEWPPGSQPGDPPVQPNTLYLRLAP